MGTMSMIDLVNFPMLVRILYFACIEQQVPSSRKSSTTLLSDYKPPTPFQMQGRPSAKFNSCNPVQLDRVSEWHRGCEKSTEDNPQNNSKQDTEAVGSNLGQIC